ncbi:NAD-dependent epimerase/dehydratase family protein [Nitratifractor salsuginis]|uniref:NAD-dependent epimerase/dehydratase n=1 Tax=Nitratifractor salsuginis (strain DSM 16511 / JCM 12458 / E9I37-1) TaxID=749222 RepID=E6X2Z5_NITSE|nr:NAD-dependent epimerase/dehydratase family protein [Nitratifractor salsuginis]ADV47278.1 NAD-dependent epimerase/dehydratase [Nitratifractor salsuginis DSM 16511]
MRILITGAAGFIGSSLAKAFDKRDDMTVLAPNREELDVSNESAVDRYVAVHKPDMIVHAANRGGGRNTIGLEDIIHNNLRMFFNIAKQMPKVDKIIQLGSGAEYGKHKPIVRAKEEDAFAAFPKDDYGFYKSVCSRYIEKTDNMINLRIFGCYGEREDYRFKFISNAVIKNLLGLPITINQNVVFDYLYIEDLVSMITHFLFNAHDFPVYNATSGAGIDLVTLANMVNEVGNNTVPVRVLHKGLNNEYTSDNSRIMEAMKGFSVTPHKVAITKMYEYFSKHLTELDTQTVREDPFIKHCNKIWKETR